MVGRKPRSGLDVILHQSATPTVFSSSNNNRIEWEELSGGTNAGASYSIDHCRLSRRGDRISKQQLTAAPGWDDHFTFDQLY